VNVRRFISGAIYALSGTIGVLAFVYPFFILAPSPMPRGLAHGQDAPLVTAALVGLSMVALLVEVQGQAISAKMVAMLGVLVAITSVLRFIEVVIPMPGGFSPIFVPVILSGYVFGGHFGFLMGAFTLLVSALVTGNVGPWLPYQMFTAGWVGLSAGWLGQILNSKAKTKAKIPNPKRLGFEVGLLCVLGFFWGLLYGAIMNIYFWPFAVGPSDQTWRPGISLGETLARYAVFYLATSLAWDMARAVGNVALILLLGAPTVRALTRFRRRFHFEVRPYA
jgi:energy-coupling factor transport system substrate-specific component